MKTGRRGGGGQKRRDMDSMGVSEREGVTGKCTRGRGERERQRERERERTSVRFKSPQMNIYIFH